MKQSEIALMIVVFLSGIAIFILWYTVPLILAKGLNYNYPLESLILAIVPFVEILAAVPIGAYVTNRDARRIGTGGLLMLLTTPILLALLSGVGAVAMVSLALGSVATEISFGAYSFNVIKNVKMKYVGTIMLLSEFGGLIGSSLGGYLLQYYNIYYILATVGILVIAAIAIFIKYIEPMKFSKGVKKLSLMSMLKEEEGVFQKFRHFMTGLSLFMFIMGFLDWGVYLLIPFLILIHSANIFFGGIIYGIVNLPWGFGDLIGSQAYKKKLKRKIIVGSLILAIILMLAMPTLLNINIYILVVLCAVSMCVAIADLALSGYILERGKKEIGEFYAFETITYEIGGIFGVILTGVTVALTGIEAISIVFTIMTGAFLFYFYVISKDVR